MKAAERLWLTPDRSKLVPEGHREAGTLYAAVGDTIPDSAVAKFGLEDGRLPRSKEAKTANTNASSQEATTGGSGNPAAPPSGAGESAESDDLTRISGIGPATAKKLNEVGIFTFAALLKESSSILPADLDVLGSKEDWVSWREQAQLFLDEQKKEAKAPDNKEAAKTPNKAGLTINKKRS